MGVVNNIEVEVRGLLTDKEYSEVKAYLETHSQSFEIDDRKTVFFVLKGKTLKVTEFLGKNKSKIALKIGDIVKDTSQVEYELQFTSEQFDIAVEIFKNLGFDKVQYTSQKRINYYFKESNISLKWSEDWGYHYEIDRVISSTQDQNVVRAELIKLSEDLGLKIMDEEEFGRRCEEIDKKHNPTI